MCRGQVLSATASPAAPVSFKAHLDCVSGVDVQFDAAASTFQVASSSWDLRCVYERGELGREAGSLVEVHSRLDPSYLDSVRVPGCATMALLLCRFAV